MEPIVGPFNEYKSFNNVILVEHQRWLKTDEVQEKNLKKLVDKRKGTLTMDDWIVCIQSWGIPVDRIAVIAKQDPPSNLWYEIDYRQ